MIYINIDGAARGNPGPAGYGIYVSDKQGETIEEAYGYVGDQTNNFAEYTALLAALKLARLRGWSEVHIRSDSQLLVRQLNGQYKVKNEVLARFYRQALSERSRFKYCRIDHVLRGENKKADKLANKAVDEQDSQPREINPILVKKID